MEKKNRDIAAKNQNANLYIKEIDNHKKVYLNSGSLQIKMMQNN